MGWIRCVRCEKFRCDFVEKTFALIALVQPILHRVLCSNETLQNTPKHYERHTNMRVQWGGLGAFIAKNSDALHGTNFCIDYTSSARFEPSFVWRREGPESTQTQQNAPKHEFRVQWGGSGAFATEYSNMILWHELLH